MLPTQQPQQQTEGNNMKQCQAWFPASFLHQKVVCCLAAKAFQPITDGFDLLQGPVLAEAQLACLHRAYSLNFEHCWLEKHNSVYIISISASRGRSIYLISSNPIQSNQTYLDRQTNAPWHRLVEKAHLTRRCCTRSGGTCAGGVHHHHDLRVGHLGIPTGSWQVVLYQYRELCAYILYHMYASLCIAEERERERERDKERKKERKKEEKNNISIYYIYIYVCVCILVFTSH